MADNDPDTQARHFAAEALAADDPTSWFERLYASAADGEAVVPWDRGAPHRLLVEWAQQRGLDGHGKRAMVVGCGLGENAEYMAALGFETVAFDVAATAIRSARQRFPGSRVDYLTADLLDPPPDWHAGFDLVVEIFTVQALPEPYHQDASHNVGRMVAPGGRLIVIAAARDEDDRPDGPPWPLTRTEIDAFATGGLRPVRVEDLAFGEQPFARCWRVEFQRPHGSAT